MICESMLERLCRCLCHFSELAQHMLPGGTFQGMKPFPFLRKKPEQIRYF